MVLGAVAQRLGRAGGVAGDERERGRADEDRVERRRGRRRGRRTGPGCSCTPCTRRRRRAARRAASASCLTLSPRYSVTNTAWASTSLAAISSTDRDLLRAAASSWFGITHQCTPPLASTRGARMGCEHHEERTDRATMERAPRLAGRTHYPPGGRTSGLRRATGCGWAGDRTGRATRLRKRPARQVRSGRQAVSGRRRLVSTWTPGPIVDDTVILRR